MAVRSRGMELPDGHDIARIFLETKGHTGGILIDATMDPGSAVGKNEVPTSYRLLRAFAMGGAHNRVARPTRARWVTGKSLVEVGAVVLVAPSMFLFVTR